ncbi:MAG: alpha/beta fold hydrolase [Rhodanobacter sp.]
MMPLFQDPLHERLGSWPLAYIPYGGADFGEIVAIADAVGDGDDDAFHAAWTHAADRLAGQADDAAAAGNLISARELLLRAACFYGKSYHPLFGRPLDARLTAGYRRQVDSFERALSLADEPVSPLQIPFGAASMPAYLLPAQGRAGETRPLLILTNGYDGSVTDLYFASAVAATRRGYHCLIFDGPGQGGMLIEQNVPLRPDLETVIEAVVDHALTLKHVDPTQIAISGWSLGGYLAPRAASAEHRLAACIADPAQAAMADSFRATAVKMGATPEAAMHLGGLDDAILERLQKVIDNDRVLHWSIVRRGYWVHGTDTLRGFLQSIDTFDMRDRIAQIRCPTLVTFSDGDPLARGVEAFHAALQCPKQILRFGHDDGTQGHCEMGNRSLLNRRVLDWLDRVLAPGFR